MSLSPTLSMFSRGQLESPAGILLCVEKVRGVTASGSAAAVPAAPVSLEKPLVDGGFSEGGGRGSGGGFGLLG